MGLGCYHSSGHCLVSCWQLVLMFDSLLSTLVAYNRVEYTRMKDLLASNSPQVVAAGLNYDASKS